MKDMPVEATPNDAPNPTCRIVMPKAKVSDMTVDQSVTLQVSGKVKSLHSMYGDSDMYEVEIEDPHVEKMDSKEEPKADKKDGKKDDMATMPRMKLKEKIQKAMDEHTDDAE